MKLDNLIIIGAAGLGLYMVARVAKGLPVGLGGSAPAPTSTGEARVTAIPNTALPGQPGWGWQYFSDGVAIGPDGRYYKGGQEVYNPLGMLGVQQ